MVATEPGIACRCPSLTGLKKGSVLLFLFLLLSMGLGPLLQGQCLPTSWVITGFVLNGAGEGVQGVDVDIIDPFTGLALSLSQDVTQTDGRFTLVICEVVTPGFYDFLFQTTPAMPYFDLLLQTVNLAGNTDVGEVTLQDASVVSGFVVGEAGQSFSEVDLDFFDPVTGLETVFSGDFTDDDGIFSVKVISDFWDIRFTEGPGTSAVPLVPRLLQDIAAFESHDLGEVLLRNGQALTGTIQDSSGSPVEGADVDVRDPVTDEEFETPGDNTDDSGVFQVLVPSGSWELEVDPPQGSELVSSLTSIAVPIGGINIGIITLPDGFTVSGSVVDTDGDVIPDTDLDFFISATGVEIPTAHDNANSSGNFSVQVEPDSYDIAFRPKFVSGAAPLVIESISVTADTNIGQVALPAGFALTGTVVAGSVPVEAVEITLNDSSTGAEVYVFGNDTDGLGAFALRQIPGTYDVTATPLVSSGFPTQVVSSLVLDADTNTVIDLLGGTAPSPPAPVESFDCVSTSGAVQLTWILGDVDYDLIQIERDGVFLTNLPGSTTSFLDQFAPLSLLQYTAMAIRDALTSAPSNCSVDNSPPPSSPPLPVSDLSCIENQLGVNLEWQLAEPDYDAIEVYFDGVLLETISGQAISFFHENVSVGIHQWGIVTLRAALVSDEISCSVDVAGSSPPLPVSDLSCIENQTVVDLEWQLGEPDYDAIEVYFDGILLETLSGQALGYLHEGVSVGIHQWDIVALRAALESRQITCSVDVAGGGPGPSFLRGDANEDLNVNVADAVFILTYLFLQGSSGSCLDAMDVNDSGSVNIADGIRLLEFLFVSGDPPEAPWPSPGEDPTPDSLPCS